VNSYWGGAVAALGGALVLGALPRIRSRQRVRDAVLLGIGVAVLANSRPYEGSVFVVPVAIALLTWMFGRKAPSWRVSLLRVLLPTSIVLAITFGAMGYYFWRVSGSPSRMPYVLNQETYANVPVFLWQPLRPAPVYHNPEMRDYYTDWERTKFEYVHHLSGFAILTLYRVWLNWLFYVGPVLTIALVAFPRVIKNRRMRLLLVVVAVTALALELATWTQVHYAAPLTCAILALLLQSMRYLRLWKWRGRPVGQLLVRVIPVGCVLSWALAGPLRLPLNPLWIRGDVERAAIVRQLEATPGRHLLLVRYDSSHTPHREWVYNRADINQAKIIWAREFDPKDDEQLRKRFKDRSIWIVEPDVSPPRLTAYSPPQEQTSAGLNR